MGIVNRSLRRPRLARRRAFQNIGDRVGHGRHPASEPYLDVSAASVHRLKDGIASAQPFRRLRNMFWSGRRRKQVVRVKLPEPSKSVIVEDLDTAFVYYKEASITEPSQYTINMNACKPCNLANVRLGQWKVKRVIRDQADHVEAHVYLA